MYQSEPAPTKVYMQFGWYEDQKHFFHCIIQHLAMVFSYICANHPHAHVPTLVVTKCPTYSLPSYMVTIYIIYTN
jgi:hypothetical protein